MKLNHNANTFRDLTVDVLLKDTDPQFERFLKAFFRLMWHTALKGRNHLDIKIKNEKNKPTGELYAKLKTYFNLEGFKFVINVDKNKVMYVSISW